MHLYNHNKAKHNKTTLKTKSHHNANIVFTAGAWGCHDDNFQCHQLTSWQLLVLTFRVHMHLIWESLYRIDSVMYWTGVRGSNGTWVTMATESTWSLSEQINKAFCCPCVIDTKLHKYKLQIKGLVTVGLVRGGTLVWYQYTMVFGDT